MKKMEKMKKKIETEEIHLYYYAKAKLPYGLVIYFIDKSYISKLKVNDKENGGSSPGYFEDNFKTEAERTKALRSIKEKYNVIPGEILTNHIEHEGIRTYYENNKRLPFGLVIYFADDRFIPGIDVNDKEFGVVKEGYYEDFFKTNTARAKKIKEIKYGSKSNFNNSLNGAYPVLINKNKQMITVKNYLEQTKDVDFSKMQGALKSGREFVDENIDLYKYDDGIKKYIDAYVNKLNAYLAQQQTAPKITSKTPPEKEKTTSAPAKKATTAKKQTPPKQRTIKKATPKSESKPAKPATEVRQVAQITPEVRFIKRYVLMDDKRKSRKQLLAFISSLQRAIEKKQIRKTSKYAKEIMHIQNELIKIYNNKDVGETFKFSLDDTDKSVLQKYQKIAGSQKQRTSVRLISRYIGIHGKTNVKEKAERLLKAIKLAFSKKQVPSSDPYRAELKKVQANLETFLKAKEARLLINKTDLKGLQGIAGEERDWFTKANEERAKKKNNTLGLIEYNHPVKAGSEVITPCGESHTVEKVKNGIAFIKGGNGRSLKAKYLQIKGYEKHSANKFKKQAESGTITAKQLAGIDYETFGFTGKWESLIGDPSKPFSLMFWSKPGKGKSTLAIELAKYMATKFGQKVLFVAAEEGLSYTLKEKFGRLKAYDDNIFIVAELPENLNPYDIIVLDSVTRMKMIPGEFVELRKKHPHKSFILVFQATGDGGYRGSKEWEHEVDVAIYINDNGYASATKTRFGGTGTIKVFSGSIDPVYKFTNLQDAEKFVANRQDEKLSIVEGDDGKKWVTNKDKAAELKKQGYLAY